MKESRGFHAGRFLALFLLACGATLATPLDPASLTKYVDPLPLPGVLPPTGQMHGAPYYEVTMSEFYQTLHTELPPTRLWGYNGSYPGPSIEARSHQRIFVRWINDLPYEHIFPVDTTIHGNEYPENPWVRTVVHVHGANVPAEFDGYPEDWFTPGHSVLYEYPMRQRATMLWYHDHALGITGQNVYAGLAGLLPLRDPVEDRLNLPQGMYEIPIVIQDRQFDTHGQLVYNHPWEPEFFGDVALVNGKVWPRMIVEPRKYRLRFLDGSNARVYNLKLFEADDAGNLIYDDSEAIDGPAFYQIGNEGGFLPEPVWLNLPGDPSSPRLLIAGAERADVIVDFSDYAGRFFLLHNNAKAPFKGLNSPIEDEAPLPEIMLFEVSSDPAADHSSAPHRLQNIPELRENMAIQTRDLTLEEMMDEEGNPTMLMLNGMAWDDPVTEKPQLGTTEIWRIINLTEDVHPIHLHLVHFQILDRQPFDAEHYMETGEIIFTGEPYLPDPNERGWKETFRANPGEIARVIMRFGDYPGRYVWHCHILEHEDNEMMRPFEVVKGKSESALNPGHGPHLEQNSPNPFNAETSIAFELSEPASVKLVVLNLLGQTVFNLADEHFESGRHVVHFNAAELPSGLYFYRLDAGQFSTQRKMLLIK